jgi:hypothetical protein
MRNSLSWLCLLALASGCTFVVKDKVDPLAQDAAPDMSFTLVDFGAHDQQLVDILLVNRLTSVVQAHAVLDPLPETEFTIELENVIAPDIVRIDFAADANDTGVIDPPTIDGAGDPNFIDHMWRTELDQNGEATFVHNFNFLDITRMDRAIFAVSDLEMMVSAADRDGERAVVNVYDSSDRQVGHYLLGTIEGGVIDIALTGIIDEGTTYEIQVAVGDDDPLCTEGVGGGDGLLIEASLDSFFECE